jgi:catechol 2,3-dioxygenase-like lactoylglutathione lyase family enzyme
MQLLDGIHHIAFITADMDRLTGFYERLFGARVIADMEEEGLRHAFIEVGPRTFLHPFQIPGLKPPGPQKIFQRGRLDHFAFNSASEEAFRNVRRRVIDEGAGDGVVTDMGTLLTFSFTDPDEGWHEVVWMKPGAPVAEGSERANWRTVEMD